MNRKKALENSLNNEPLEKVEQLMARYKKNKGFCKNHPDIEALPHRNLCRDCYNQRVSERRKYEKIAKREYNRKYYAKIKSKGIPSPDELKKLIELKYDNHSIAQRYLVHSSTVDSWLRGYGLKSFVRRLESNPKDKPDQLGFSAGIINSYDIFTTARPKHQKNNQY